MPWSSCRATPVRNDDTGRRGRPGGGEQGANVLLGRRQEEVGLPCAAQGIQAEITRGWVPQIAQPKSTPSISALGVMSGKRRIRNEFATPSREAAAGMHSATWSERLRDLVLISRTAS